MDAFAAPPDPGPAGNVDDLVERLRLLKIWGGDPSYEMIKERVNAAWTGAGRPAGELARRSTVASCFQPGRRRLNTDLVIAVVEALHPDAGYVAQWRQSLRVVGGEIAAVSQVRVQDSLPPDLPDFTGRVADLDQLRAAAQVGDAVVISALEGMAGVGKTQLAVHAGHQLAFEKTFDRVLFVNLRGFHPDPAQPPADPAAVLDGFLRLLGMPGHRIPFELDARTDAYRSRLAGLRALVVLDNAATAEQVRPLLPEVPGCLTLITSRHRLTDLRRADHLAVDVFTMPEALAFLAAAVPGVPAGTDPDAAARIAERCGCLPLALSLIAGHIRKTPGWTLTDHADRLDERRDERRMDSGVQLSLDLSYQDLPAAPQRLLRLLALHPGQDFDGYAAAALAGTDLPAALTRLAGLRDDHLLQESTPGRYTFHDLVRAYATDRAHDEDAPGDRRAALTRLFDHFLATAGAAMNALYPAEAHRRPPLSVAGTPGPDLTDPDAAVGWLDTERPTLVAVAGHGSTTMLAQTLSRYLNNGYYTDALTLHGLAHRVARAGGDRTGQAHALAGLGFAHLCLGRTGPAAEEFQQAHDLFQLTGNPSGQARTLFNLGSIELQAGRYAAVVDYMARALTFYRQSGDRSGEAVALNGLGLATERLGRLPEAIDHLRQALELARETGNRRGESIALHTLGELETRTGEYGPAADHLDHALILERQLGNRPGEAGTLDSLGALHTRLGRRDQATDYHRQALTIFRETGHQEGEAWALNGLGEAAEPADAITFHTEALTIATDIGAGAQRARAQAGLGQAHQALGDQNEARTHFEQALAGYTTLGLPEADQIRTHLAGINDIKDPVISTP
ncbi:tetratricopeptide (TPR) repeat protein [Actinoplanes tereljensis]|nr:tetratricopeptide repeat protein [Actinoplanes tereljensis]